LYLLWNYIIDVCNLCLRIVKRIISKIGYCPLCNFRKKSGWYIGKFCFPLCTRCTAIISSFTVTKLFTKAFELNLKMELSWIWIALLIPCCIDGFRQYVMDIESNNLKRLITGLLAGIGLAFLNNSIRDSVL